MNQMQTDANKTHFHVDEMNMQDLDIAPLSQAASQDCVKTQKTSPLFASETSDKCTHDYSVMTTSHPNSFIRFPYRPAVMTLLRQVETYEVDIVATEHGSDKPRVYASFQNHWSPNINVPVLSLVGACNTVLSPPTFRRRKFDWATVTIMASTSQMQHDVSFKVPLILNQESATKHVVLEMVRAHDLGDHMTQYIIHPQDIFVPLLIVKIWNLSRYGCNQLHLASTYLAPRANVQDELHIFGLSGERQTAYKIMYHSLTDGAMSMLTEEDLIAIGYRRWEPPKPTFPKNDEDSLEDHNPKNLMARMLPVQPARITPGVYRLAVIPTKKTIYQRRKTPNILYYPPANKHRAEFNDRKPTLFPTGYYSFRDVFMPKYATVRDVCNDLHKARGKRTPSAATVLAYQCGVPVKTVLENLSTNFRNFVKKYKVMDTNKECLDLRPYVTQPAPQEWIHARQHEIVSDLKTLLATVWKGQEYKFVDDPDEEPNQELIEDEIIRQNKRNPKRKRELKWFPNQPTRNPEENEEEIEEYVSSEDDWTESQVNLSMMQLEKDMKDRKERMKHILEKQKRQNDETVRERFTPMRIEEIIEADVHQPDPVQQDIPEVTEEIWKSLNKENFHKKAQHKKKRISPPEANVENSKEEKKRSPTKVSPAKTSPKKISPKKKMTQNKKKKNVDTVNTEKDDKQSPRKMMNKTDRGQPMTKDEQIALIDGIISADPTVFSQVRNLFQCI